MNWRSRLFKLLSAIGILCLSLPSTASAHPGHETTSADPYSVQHYILEPLHLVPVVALFVLAIVGYVAFVRWHTNRGPH